MVEDPKEQAQTPLVWWLRVFIAVVAAQLLSAALWSQQGGTHVAWFPGAVLLAVLLTVTPVIWLGCITSALVGMAVVALGFQVSVADTLLVVAAPFLLVPVAARILLWVPGGNSPLEDFGKLAAFGAVAVIALPLISAACIAYVSRFTAFRNGVLGDWRNIALAHSLGYALFVPVWMSLRSPDAAIRHQGRFPWMFMLIEAVLIGLLASMWRVWGSHAVLVPLLCLAPALLIIAASVRMQMTGSSIVVFAIVVVAARLSVTGGGPFVANTPQATTLALQLWALIASTSALAFGVVVEQRFAARRALQVANVEVRSMAARLIATMEQERARLARDLHDDINQRLAVSSIGLSSLRRRLAPEFRGEVARIQEQVVGLSDDVRHLSHDLHPSCVSHAGLYDALERLCDGSRREAGPDVVLVADHRVDELPSEIGLCLFRIAQEALGNAIRHARARTVTMKLSVNASYATLWIFDDGIGFAPGARQRAQPGLGLVSMHERAKLLGGTFEVRSIPGRGVDLCIRIPLDMN